jgi:hypothetical protein
MRVAVSSAAPKAGSSGLTDNSASRGASASAGAWRVWSRRADAGGSGRLASLAAAARSAATGRADRRGSLLRACVGPRYFGRSGQQGQQPVEFVHQRAEGGPPCGRA